MSIIWLFNPLISSVFDEVYSRKVLCLNLISTFLLFDSNKLVTSLHWSPTNKLVTSLHWSPTNKLVTSLHWSPTNKLVTSLHWSPTNKLVTSLHWSPTNKLVTSLHWSPTNKLVTSLHWSPTNKLVTSLQWSPTNTINFFRCAWLIDIKSVKSISHDFFLLRIMDFNQHILPFLRSKCGMPLTG